MLQTAARHGLISLADALQALQNTNFRHSAALFDQLLSDELRGEP